MLDAIASAPFLVVAQAAALASEEPAAGEHDIAEQPQPVVEARDYEPATHATVNAQEPEITAPAEPDHEIAASAPEPVVETKAPETPAIETAEAKRHAIHGAPEEEPKEPSAPRRMGWWSRRKTG